jgi:prolyl-tRNA synthetase
MVKIRREEINKITSREENFSKSFNISFSDEKQEKQYVWQTSWGLSTRIIGALIMSHSDNKGLVLPPKIAPFQVVVIPIWSTEDEKKIVFEEMGYIKNELESCDIAYTIDDRDKRPGFKYFEWERKGVPLRIEIGLKDIQKKSVVIVERLEGKKEFVKNKEMVSFVKDNLKKIQATLLQNSKKHLLKNTREVSTYEEFKKVLEKDSGFVFAHLCLDENCEKKIKEETGADSRCIPFEGGLGNEGACVYCKKKASNKVLFAKAY